MSVVGRLALVSTAMALCCCIGATHAVALSVGRSYEMVSPAFKDGYNANNLVAVATSGKRVVFGSFGAFAGDPTNTLILNYYTASRQVDGGWAVEPIALPATISPWSEVSDLSLNLDRSIDNVRVGTNIGNASEDSVQNEFLLHAAATPDTAPNAPSPGPNFELVGMVLEDLSKTPFRVIYEDASANFDNIAFTAPDRNSEQLLPEAQKTESHLYTLGSSGCGSFAGAVCAEGEVDPASGPSSLRLVGLNNKGRVVDPACSTELGLGVGGAFNAVSSDGSELFFRTDVDGGCADGQVFVRLDGQKTLEVSRPLIRECHEVPCPEASARKPARFQGAAEDGTKVFFTSEQPLVTGQTDTSVNLYMATIGCPPAQPACEAAEREVTGLVQVSRDPHAGQPAAVRGVVSLAPDGSHAYFVANGDLLEEAEAARLEAEGRARPRAGADNLYVYDSVTKTTQFIGDLCSGSQLSGTVEDIDCPVQLPGGESSTSENDSLLWANVEHQAQVNVCDGEEPGVCGGARETGRFLVFSTFARLSADDTDNSKDVYRFDSATGALERVSVGEAHHDANGNRDGSDAVLAPSLALIAHTRYGQRDMGTRAIDEDGSRIVFTSAEPLSSAAGNGLSNAYEWHDGYVSLVSTGSATAPVERAVISSSGSDAFFLTTQGLVPTDTDGQGDVYDLHECTTTAPCASSSPTEAEPCAGDACQGPLTNPAPLLVPASLPHRVYLRPVSPPRPHTKKKRRPRPKKRRARHVRNVHWHGHGARGGRR